MFDAYLEPLREKWLSLSQRDQMAARLLGVFIVIGAVIFGVIMPIYNVHTDLESELTRAEDVLTELTALAPRAMTASGTVAELNAGAMNSEIRRQAARNGIELQRFEPDGDFLRVWLEDARYPSVVQWLGSLETMGITHTELTMDDRPQPGMVNVRVTFGIDS